MCIRDSAAENRERKAKRDRELVLRSLPDGMASVRANAPADAAMSIFTLADLLADRTGADDDRPVAARRVDAWHDIAEQLLTHGYVDLTDLLDHAEPSGEPVSAQGMLDTDDDLAADVTGEPAATPTPIPRPEQASGSVDSGEHDSGEHDSGEHPSPTPTNPEDAANGPTRKTANSADADQAGTAGRDGAVITYPANQQSTPDQTARTADGATPSAAQRLQCATCGGYEPETLSASTTGNREDRRASRRAARQGRRPHLTVTLSASTLAGLDRLPGHLEGYGAITAEMALMIAKSAASITAVLLD